jgi:8-oxo-dGTP pyrophosphatase MutT (NUDIX family)
MWDYPDPDEHIVMSIERMKLPLALTAAHVINVVILAAVGGWFGHEGGWEPVVTFLAFSVPYFATGRALLRVVSQAPEPLPPVFEPEDFGSMVNQAIGNIPVFGDTPKPLADLTPSDRSRDRQVSGVVLSFFRNLGLVKIDQNNLVAPVSERALAFLKSIGHTLQDDAPFIGDWTAVRTGNAENDKLRRILQEAEEFRVTKKGKNAPSTRMIKSAIILLKGKFQGTDRYLLQWSDAWGSAGYYWFIGGIMESQDKSIEDCAYRELLEELGLERPMIQSLTKLGTQKDKRISYRVGALTSYQYSVFSATLDSRVERVKEIYKLQFTDEASVCWTTHERNSKWHTWDEIMQSQDLQRDAGRIVKAVAKSGVEAIPISTTLEITD